MASLLDTPVYTIRELLYNKTCGLVGQPPLPDLARLIL